MMMKIKTETQRIADSSFETLTKLQMKNGTARMRASVIAFGKFQGLLVAVAFSMLLINFVLSVAKHLHRHRLRRP
jgi:hypothetical protein